MKYTYFLMLSILFISCKENKDQPLVDYTIQNEAEIEKYLEDNNLDAEKSTSGLYYIIDVAGSGPMPTATSNVTVAYKGYFTNKSVFDQSEATGISFGLQQVIKGWTEGITYFKEGGSGLLLIPSHLGYGSSGTNGIPGGAVLIFDINLISVN